MSDYKILDDSEINKVGFGVQNCGNSCFFNATNQMLFHIPEFRHFLISNKDKFTDEYIKSYIGLFEQMNLNTQTMSGSCVINGNKTLNHFYYDTQKKFFGARSGIQQDAEQYLGYILDHIYENGFLKNENFLIPKIKTKRGYLITYISKKILYNTNYDFFFDLKYITKQYCKSRAKVISNESIKIDYLSYIQIPSVKQKYKGIDCHIFNIDSINIEQEEKLTSDNLLTKCTDARLDSYKKTSCEIKNKYLFINLVFKSDNVSKGLISINGTILEPAKISTIPDLKIKTNNYELIGFVTHHGGLGGGHYWYNHKINNKWYEFNDSAMSSGLNYTLNLDETNKSIYSDNLKILLFRRKSEPYRYLKFDYDIINRYIINANRNFYLQNIDDDNYLSINIKMLVFYTNYLNVNNKYIPEITALIDALKRNIARLLT